MSELICMVCGKEVGPKEFDRAHWPHGMDRINGAVVGELIKIAGHTTCVHNVNDLVVIPNRIRVLMLQKLVGISRRR